MKWCRCCLVLFLLGWSAALCLAQPTGVRPGRQNGAPVFGKLYGKIVEEPKGGGLEFAVVKLFLPSTSGAEKDSLVTGAITSSNGSFILEQVPAGKELILKVQLLGYEDLERRVELPLPSGRMASSEKDLGNFGLALIGVSMDELVIEGVVPDYRIEFDKRVYDVDKNPANAGGTAEDVLRNIPAVQVDLDGNVSVRNAAPQIFVDGRPSTLSIDQIPSDAIQKIEVITNPSAKYDAGGGRGGIINIVMKHNRSMGYNGNLRAGIDMRARYNAGLNLNLREGAFNLFLNGNYNQRKSLTTGETERHTLDGPIATDLFQTQNPISEREFTRGNIGLDWFADIRNTFTLSQSYSKGEFNNQDSIFARTDTLHLDHLAYSTYRRISTSDRDFTNLGSSLLYKHLFAKEGTELTADVNYNSTESNLLSHFDNLYNSGESSILRQDGITRQSLYTAQSDFSSILNKKNKLETGVRVAVRNYNSSYDNYALDPESNAFIPVTGLTVNYAYLDRVYAGYATFSRNLDKWKYQLGLRAESSDYQGELKDTSVTFRNSYPLSLFPSLFITKVLNEKQDVQLSMNRQISRPSFMQLTPFTDYSDSLNITRGNPDLKPEFTHSAELSWQYVFNKQNTFIATTYLKYTTGITIGYQQLEYSSVLNNNVIVSTYANAASSMASGIELVSNNSITKWFGFNTNLNIYHSRIDGSNIVTGLENRRTSWSAKANFTFRIPMNFTFQVMGEYESKKALDTGRGDRGYGGGGMYGGTSNTLQGYILPKYGIDLSLKKDFLKKQNASISFSVRDVFKSEVNNTHSESAFFVQDTWRQRDTQFYRIQFSLRFGKVDASLFRRKNTRTQGDEMEGM